MPAPNAAFVYCTGPVEVFIRFPENNWTNPQLTIPPSGQIYYLGTTELTPEIDEQPQEKPIYTAQSGDMVPFDDMYMGTLLQVNLNLSRFSQTLLQRLQNAPNHGRINAAPAGGAAAAGLIAAAGLGAVGAAAVGLAAGIPGMGNIEPNGIEMFGERGTMMLAQGRRPEIWLYNSFYPQLNMYPDMHPGLYLPAVKTVRVFRPSDGLAASKAQVTIEAKCPWRAGARSFWQYSMLPADFADIIAGNVSPG